MNIYDNQLAIKIHVLWIFLVIDKTALRHISFIGEPQFPIYYNANERTRF